MKSNSDQRKVPAHPEAVDAPPSPWPAILERLPEYEPDTLLLSLEFYRESVVRRLIDDDGRQSLALMDIAEVARALSAGVSLSSGILPATIPDPIRCLLVVMSVAFTITLAHVCQ